MAISYNIRCYEQSAMFRYKFLALCVLACLALGCSTVKAETSSSSSSNVELLRNVDVDIRKIDIEQYDGIIDAIVEYLKDFFAQATTNCLKEVAKNCKKIWYNPKKLVKCAKEYFKEHKGECAIPDTLEYETMLMSIYNEDDIEDVDMDISKIDIETYDGIVDTIIDYLKDFFQQASINCLKEVAKNCKKIWYNPKKLVKCAKKYFKEHQGECAIPDSLQYETLLMSIPSDDDVRDIDIRQLDIEKYDGIIDAIIEYLKDFFAQATTNCLKEVAKNCKKIWYNPKKLVKCAKKYFKEHEGECAIPDTLEYETMIMSIYGENDAENVEMELRKIDIENYGGIIDTIIDYLKDFFEQASINCLKEVAKNCKKIWYNPKKLVKCAKKYFKEHKGECAIPDSMTYENLLMTIDNDTELVELTDESIEIRGNPALKAIIKALMKVFGKMAAECIKEAANHCKGHWPNVPGLIHCAEKYFKANKGRCALG